MFDGLLGLFAKTGAQCSKAGFLDLKPWYHYLKNMEADCTIRNFNLLPEPGGRGSDLPLVLLAVIDDLLRLAGLIAVIFVIYGAVLYTTSQGNADQTSRAQSTIINALAGLVITIVAVAFVTFIGGRLA